MPLVLGLLPAVKVPAVVFEIIGGVVVGPPCGLGPPRHSGAGGIGLGAWLPALPRRIWIDLRLLNRHSVDVAGRAFVVSAGLALGVAYMLQASGLVKDGLLVGITLLSTSLGILVPILKDAGQSGTDFGRLIMTAASFAELVPLVMLSLFFSAHASNSGPRRLPRPVRRLCPAGIVGDQAGAQLGRPPHGGGPSGGIEFRSCASACR